MKHDELRELCELLQDIPDNTVSIEAMKRAKKAAKGCLSILDEVALLEAQRGGNTTPIFWELLAERDKLKEEVGRKQQRRFPIMDGPNVPWEAIAPYEKQAYSNHGQTLERLAERGGLACSEACAVVEGLDWYSVHGDIEGANRRWRAWAERINLRFVHIQELEAQLQATRE